ncbi:MAG: hypothetical protein RL033_2060, partial [Pseudomonadota bacterium]
MRAALMATKVPVWLAGLVSRSRILVVVACLLLPQQAAFCAEAQITRVEPYASRDAARVVLYVSEPVHFERAGDDSGEAARRLYIDLPGTTYTGPASFELKGLLQRVRVTPAEGKLRVMLELSEPGQQSVFFLPQPFRVVIDVARSAASRSKEPAPPVRSLAPAGNHAERVVRRIALDPGHGGAEPGATGPRGIREKDIVLDIAHRA